MGPIRTRDRVGPGLGVKSVQGYRTGAWGCGGNLGSGGGHME